MKIVNTDIKYQIYDDSLRTFDFLPAAHRLPLGFQRPPLALLFWRRLHLSKG